jgi:ribosomal protein L36
MKNSKLYYQKNKDRIKSRTRTRSKNIKIEVITHYGNGKCACVKCGFSDIRALTIDHIIGNGNDHRKTNDIRGDHIYQWLRKNNMPKGYQTLCMNCQLIKRLENKEYYFKPTKNVTCRYKNSNYFIQRNKQIKIDVITNYGNNNCSCIKCSFDDIRALTIDHTNGDGAKHRRKFNIRGNYIYEWLRKRNYPDGFQTLCANCQFIKRFENKELIKK